MNFPIGGLSEELWMQSFQYIRFPVVVIDRGLNTIIMNSDAANLFPQARNLKDIEPSPYILNEVKVRMPIAEDICDMVIENPQVGGFCLIGLKDGLIVVVHASTAPGFEAAVDYCHLFIMFKQTARQLQAKNDRLEVYHELLTHDAPNYITAVYGYLQMMQAQELPLEKLAKYINTSIKQTEALNHLIDTARALRQLETTPLGPTSPQDLRTMIEESIVQVQGTDSKPASIHDDISPGTFLVDAEPSVGDVFNIILTNAVRYSDSPQVDVSLVPEDRDWHLRFADNGRGIPDEKKEFVFLRFDRLDRQRKIRGSGLSLALARALVERHGGRIWVENRVAGDYTKGSVFHVLLPRSKSTQVPQSSL